jgi:hypothetical protein
MKQALGLAVSGTEVRLAHLTNHNGQIRITGLERARLQTTLENQPDYNDGEPNIEEAEAKDAFGLKDALGGKENRKNESKPENGNNGNLEILYRLLEKYTQKKIKIAFNLPLSMVTYQRPDIAATRIAGADKDAESSIAQEIVTAHDGTQLIMSYEKLPPTMTLMREVNDFLRGNLFLALMDSTEVALANLARRSVEFEANKVTAIVYIEEDFTRLIFLRGKDLFHVSSIIHENTASPDILEVIYRKLIYEQDEAEIPEISSILLAGKCSRINAADFFATHFETAKVQYLSSSLAANSPATGAQAGLFSEFAVPIALAWKTLEPKSPFFIPTNLLPQDVLDQQQVLKLNYHGYILLALTGLLTFFFTWQILNLSGSIRETRKKNTQLEMQIANNQETVDRVFLLDNQCQRLKKSISLADSLSRGHNELLVFLQKLNGSLGRVGNIWVDEIVTNSDGFTMRGSSMSRESIPLLAEKLGNASLRQMTRVESEKQKAFSFSLERHNAPNTSQALAQGLSTIDAARYAGNGKLMLGKQGARPAPALPATNGSKSLPAMTKSEASRSPQATIAEANKKSLADANGTASKPPTVRPAAATQPAANAKGLDKNTTLAKTTSPATARKSDLAAPPKIETKTAAPPAVNATRTLQSAEKSSSVASNMKNEEKAAANEVARARQSEEKNFNFANDTRNDNVSWPAQKSTNGSANTEMQKFNQAAEASTVQMPAPPMNTSKLASSAAVSKPANVAPEIYRGYTIEAATSYTKELAEQFASAYRKQGYDAAVELYQDERTKAQKYRVLIGAFATRPAAEQKAAQMAGILMKDYRVVGLK